MTYNKPEITVLGDAVDVIQLPNKGATADGPSGAGAYDLDE
jgi:hypothetical protein